MDNVSFKWAILPTWSKLAICSLVVPFVGILEKVSPKEEDLEETEQTLQDLQQQNVIQEEKLMWIDWCVDVYSTSTYGLITVAVTLCCFNMTWMCSSLSSSEQQLLVNPAHFCWVRLKCTDTILSERHIAFLEGEAWACRGDNLHLYLGNNLTEGPRRTANPLTPFDLLHPGEWLMNLFFFSKQAFVSVSTSPEQKRSSLKWAPFCLLNEKAPQSVSMAPPVW